MIHRWPRRLYHDITDTWGNRIGVSTEPVGHDEHGMPLYQFFDSESQETRTLNEDELIGMLYRLKNPKTKP